VPSAALLLVGQLGQLDHQTAGLSSRMSGRSFHFNLRTLPVRKNQRLNQTSRVVTIFKLQEEFFHNSMKSLP